MKSVVSVIGKRFLASQASPNSSNALVQKYRVLVIGGGSGGISVAAQLATQHLDSLKNGTFNLLYLVQIYKKKKKKKNVKLMRY